MSRGADVAHPSRTRTGLKGVDAFIGGHNPTTMTAADLRDVAAFSRDYVAWVQEQMQAGKTPEQAASEYEVPATYAGYTVNIPARLGGPSGYINTIYNDLKK